MTVIDVTERTSSARSSSARTRSRSSSTSGPSGAARAAARRPLLERAAAAREGQVVLAKLDTDANPAIARGFGIQGIPAVKAFSGRARRRRVRRRAAARAGRALLRRARPERGRRPRRGRRRGVAAPRARARARPRRRRRSRSPSSCSRAASDEPLWSWCGRCPASRPRASPPASASRRPASPTSREAFAALDAGDERARGRPADRRAAGRRRAQGRHPPRAGRRVLDELGVEHPLARDARRRLAAALY